MRVVSGLDIASFAFFCLACVYMDGRQKLVNAPEGFEFLYFDEQQDEFAKPAPQDIPGSPWCS